ncbi:hypothetical protein D3C80_1594580 [compost metagenome]
MKLEEVRARAHRHALFPVRAVGRLALELQRLDGIERDNVVGVQPHEPVNVLGDHQLPVRLDQVLDIGVFCVCIHDATPSVLCEDTLSRLTKKQIDSRNKKISKRQTG